MELFSIISFIQPYLSSMEDYLMIIVTGNTDFSFMYPISMITTTKTYNTLQLQTHISDGLFFVLCLW